jgi:hypothetical protein
MARDAALICAAPTPVSLQEDKAMLRLLPVVALIACATTPALADTYPVSGRFGVVQSFTDKPPDCTGKRTIAFNGDQRTDSKGGVPAYRNRSVTANGASAWKVIDIFTTGQISNAQAVYTLRAVKDGQLEMNMQPGGMIRLQKCK